MSCLTAMKKKRAEHAARDAIRARESQRLQEDIKRFLKEHGPTDFAKLVQGLQTTTGRLSLAGRALQDSGAIHRYRAYQGRDSRRIWSLEPQPPREPKPRSEARKPDIGMDSEHLQWIEKYQRRAELRRQGKMLWATT